MKPTQSFKLSDSDIEAILTALPIVENYPADSAVQKLHNQVCCRSAREKLLGKRKDFAPNELRVIAIAVCYVSEYLSGRMPELAKLHPDISQVRAYALAYVRLGGYFRPHLMDPGS